MNCREPNTWLSNTNTNKVDKRKNMFVNYWTKVILHEVKRYVTYENEIMSAHCKSHAFAKANYTNPEKKIQVGGVKSKHGVQEIRWYPKKYYCTGWKEHSFEGWWRPV